MKFLVAFVAAASAADFTVCSFTQTFHTKTDCTDAASKTTAMKAVVNECNYHNDKSAWYKVTKCETKGMVKMSWYSDGACTGTPAADKTTDYKKKDTCYKTKPASTEEGSKLTVTPAKISSVALCGGKIHVFTQNDCAADKKAGSGDQYAAKGIKDDGTSAWIKNEVYFIYT